MKENKNRAKRDTSHFKIHLLTEISPNTEFNMLKFITTYLNALGSARIKTPIWEVFHDLGLLSTFESFTVKNADAFC